MLPIKRFTEIGFPFHGLVVDGVLTLPNSATMAWPVAASPFTQVLRNTVNVANAPTRTTEQAAADTAAGRQWLDYALRNGSRLNGRLLSSNQWILYSDPAGTVWLIENRAINSSTQFRPRLYVIGVFGRVHYGITPPDLTCDRLIYSADITPTDDEVLVADNYYVGSILQNESGSKVLYKGFRVIKGTVYGERYAWTEYATQEQDAGARLSDLYEITIGGTGSLEAGNIGAGITASASLVADYSALYNDTSSFTGVIETGIVAQCCGPFGSKTWQVVKAGACQGPSASETVDMITEFDAKIDAYYDATGTIKYVERYLKAGAIWDWSASATSSISSNETTTTICRSLSGFEDYQAINIANVRNAGITISGSYSLESNETGPGDVCLDFPVAQGVPICSEGTGYTLAMSGTTTETGSEEESEVYVSTITTHGLVLVAQGYDDSGTKRYTRTVIAPDGETLVIDPVDAPLNFSKMNPDGIAWHPVTGDLVWYPGQIVGFV